MHIVYIECVQVAVVDANQGRTQLQGTVQFSPVMYFHQHVQAMLYSSGGQLFHL